MTAQNLPAIVAITGASGAAYGVKAIDLLADNQIPVHLVISTAGQRTLKEELGLDTLSLRNKVTAFHPIKDIGASIASGSFLCRGMIVAPCSVKTMSEIASGVTGNLISRAGDVMLKERRPLILMVRETPFHLGHLKTMTSLTEMGAIIAPPLPAFYTKPESLDDIVHYSVSRALDLLGIHLPIKRWTGS